MAKNGKKCLVIDHGDNVWAAKELTRWYEKVYYCYPDWSCGFTEVAACELGSGFKGVEKVNYWASVIDEVDTILYTDVEFSGFAQFLKDNKDRKYRVWGSGDVEHLELDRGDFLKSLEEAGLPVPKTTTLKGFSELEKFLKGKEDVYVKLSHYRAIRETFHYINDIVGQNILTYIKIKIGCFADEVEFYVQEPIESDFEWGVDLYTVNGKIPKSVQFGFEKKSILWFGRQMKVSELQPSMQEVLNKYSKVLQKYKYTGFVSFEVRRAKDGQEFFIDLTPRIPLPAGATYLSMGTNWGEVIEKGLDGEMVELETDKKYGAEVILTTTVLDEYDPILIMDEEHEENNFKPSVSARREGITWRLPNNQLYNATNKLGFVTVQDDNLDKAIEKCKEICESVHSNGVEYNADFESFVQPNIDNLKKVTGIKF